MPTPAAPLIVLVTGVQGTGKSTIAGIVADHLDAPLLAHDWAMSGLRPYPSIQRVLEEMQPSGHRVVGWSILRALARSHLRRRASVVLDGVARRAEIEELNDLAESEEARLIVLMAQCSDAALLRSRVEGRDRRIPGWYELDWDHVQRALERWEPVRADLTLEASQPLEQNRERIFEFFRGVLGSRRSGRLCDGD